MSEPDFTLAVGVYRAREILSGRFIRRYYLKDEQDGAMLLTPGSYTGKPQKSAQDAIRIKKLAGERGGRGGMSGVGSLDFVHRFDSPRSIAKR